MYHGANCMCISDPVPPILSDLGPARPIRALLLPIILVPITAMRLTRVLGLMLLQSAHNDGQRRYTVPPGPTVQVRSGAVKFEVYLVRHMADRYWSVDQATQTQDHKLSR